MKKSVLLLLIAGIALNISAQTVGNQVKFYSPKGETFTLFINGRKMNDTPNDVVELKQIYANALNVKVVLTSTPNDTISQKQLPITNATVDDMPCPYQTVYKLEKIKAKKKQPEALGFVLEKMECIYETPKRYQPKK